MSQHLCWRAKYQILQTNICKRYSSHCPHCLPKLPSWVTGDSANQLMLLGKRSHRRRLPGCLLRGHRPSSTRSYSTFHFPLQVGKWSASGGLNITEVPKRKGMNITDSLANRSLVISTILVRLRAAQPRGENNVPLLMSVPWVKCCKSSLVSSEHRLSLQSGKRLDAS